MLLSVRPPPGVTLNIPPGTPIKYIDEIAPAMADEPGKKTETFLADPAKDSAPVAIAALVADEVASVAAAQAADIGHSIPLATPPGSDG